MTVSPIAPRLHPSPRRQASSWLRIRAIARRHWYVVRRSPHRLFDVTVWPIVDVLLYGSLGTFFAQAEGGTLGRSAFGYLMAGVLLWHVVYSGQISLATGFLEEAWSRNMLNLMVTPLREWEYVAGVVLLGLAKLAAGLLIVALMAVGLFAFDITDLGWTLAPVAAVLLMTGWVIALFVIGLVLRFGAGAEAMAWGVLFVMLPLSGVFYPVDALPGALQPVARLLPTTHAFAASRSVLDGGGVPWGRLGLAALSTVGLAAVGLVWVVAMLRVFRKRGYVTRYS